ncbi:ATP-binding protein [Paraflavitalea sp. CAU 1676]|uniref:ATP-binding protein n=1 Tax=Paraflavitalea sp. CAU 1676 TaxID=3032598 RepID=UPI0023DB9480|nr:ATP-binding protein [Paraflavitalea sp. CAU 1676]MDF2188605.1 ATP-binding protein [Paraflavitalea sp. CAU 1676]
MSVQNNFEAFHEKMQATFPAMYAEANEMEAMGISLCLVPILHSDLLDNFIKQEFGAEGDFPLAGGIRGNQHRGIMPTGETWMYCCCGNDTAKRVEFIQTIPVYLSLPNSLLNIEAALPGEPFLSGRLVFSSYFRKQFQDHSLVYEQRFSNLNLGGFMNTQLTLDDLVLTEPVKRCIDEIKHWQYFQEHNTGSVAFTKRLKQGLKVIFFGKSGTGKTQTATIMAQQLGKPIYRIDLSQIVSKYIGETEKNLSKIFEAAEHKNWVLFFDEGDALFGKRTSVNSSNDRYANQEVAYLLQRIEDYPGIIILSTNLKENIDPAFLRRFQIIAEFPMPDQVQRHAIWEKLLAELPEGMVQMNELDWSEITKTELSGGGITNIIQYALLKSTYQQVPIGLPMLKEGIIRELRKENRLTSL